MQSLKPYLKYIRYFTCTYASMSLIDFGMGKKRPALWTNLVLSVGFTLSFAYKERYLSSSEED